MNAVVYRFFDAEGALLYVGSTGNLESRLGQHRCLRPDMMARVASQTVEAHPDRDSALRAERIAIHTERPELNVVGAQPMPSQSLARVIDEMRRACGFTWREFAAAAGEPLTSLHRNVMHDSDSLSARALFGIAKALDTRASYLIELTEIEDAA